MIFETYRQPSDLDGRGLPRHGGVLVAVTLDAPSAVALERGHELARRIDWPLHVVHVCEDGDVTGAAARVVTWASTETGLTLPLDAIIVRSGRPVAEIWRAASAIHADLLVLGGAVGDSTPGWLVRFLAQHARRPVLIASRPHRPSIVAGTSLREHALPILEYATLLAQTTGASLRAVHNVAPEGVARARELVAGVSDVLAEEPDTQAHPLDDVIVTQSARPSDALLEIARSSDADLVVVGTHETSGHTLRELVIDARCSVLAVPLGRLRDHERRPLHALA